MGEQSLPEPTAREHSASQQGDKQIHGGIDPRSSDAVRCADLGGEVALGGREEMSRKKAQDYLTGPYSRILIRNEDGTFSAEIMEFPGCFAEGATREEALNNLDRAAEEWIESSLKHRGEIAEPFSVRGFSGAVSLRLPRWLH